MNLCKLRRVGRASEAHEVFELSLHLIVLKLEVAEGHCQVLTLDYQGLLVLVGDLEGLNEVLGGLALVVLVLHLGHALVDFNQLSFIAVHDGLELLSLADELAFVAPQFLVKIEVFL